MDLFDFNNDGKVDDGECWIAYQIMKESEKQSEVSNHPVKPRIEPRPAGKVGCGCALQLLGLIIFICTISGESAGLGLFFLFLLGIAGGIVGKYS